MLRFQHEPVFVSEIVTPPAHLPVTVAAADQALAAAVVEEIERVHLWRAIVAQTRRILIDGPLPARIELEPTTAIVSLTRWTPRRRRQRDRRGQLQSYVTSRETGRDHHCSRSGVMARARTSVRELRAYLHGGLGRSRLKPRSMLVTRLTKSPPAIQLMIEARNQRLGPEVDWATLTIGSLTIGLADSYKTDRTPA